MRGLTELYVQTNFQTIFRHSSAPGPLANMLVSSELKSERRRWATSNCCRTVSVRWQLGIAYIIDMMIFTRSCSQMESWGPIRPPIQRYFFLNLKWTTSTYTIPTVEQILDSFRNTVGSKLQRNIRSRSWNLNLSLGLYNRQTRTGHTPSQKSWSRQYRRIHFRLAST